MPRENKFISCPGEKDLKEQLARFGCFETLGHRQRQEDALAWHEMQEKDISHLTPEAIGHRLWTTYQLLDAALGDITDGTTASTTVYDGKNHLITATLADAASFAAVYGSDNQLLGVVRLNSITHKPDNQNEHARIKQAGSFVDFRCDVPRVRGELAVSRAIGDRAFGKAVPADAQIDMMSFDELAKQLGTDSKSIAKVQVITTCDGFTDGAGDAQTKEDQEAYLSKLLHQRYVSTLSESNLAEKLAKRAIEDGSGDNVSVSVQTIIPGQKTPTVQGVYDGHGGVKAAHYVAKNMFSVFKKQCQLKNTAYAAQSKSIFQVEEGVPFFRDHLIRQIIDGQMKTQLSDVIKLNVLPHLLESLSSEEGAIVIHRYFEDFLDKIDILSDDLNQADKKVATTLRDNVHQALSEFLDAENTSPNAYKNFEEACNEAIAKARPTLEKHRGWDDFFAKLVLTILTLGTVPLLLSVYNKHKKGCFGYSLFPSKGEQIADDVGDVVKGIDPKKHP